MKDLEAELQTVAKQNMELEEEVRSLNDKLKGEQDKYRTLWRMNCDQLQDFDETIAVKEREILSLEAKFVALEGGSAATDDVTGERARSSAGATENLPRSTEREHPPGVARLAGASPPTLSRITGETLTIPGRSSGITVGPLEPRRAGDEWKRDPVSALRRGKALPVDTFSGEAEDTTFEDWLPGLQRAAEWNRWSDKETLIQLAGYLRGRALQEWTLLRNTDKESLPLAISALRGRLDPCSKVVAAQDFRHASQREDEPVSDYIRCLEQLFRRAFVTRGCQMRPEIPYFIVSYRKA